MGFFDIHQEISGLFFFFLSGTLFKKETNPYYPNPQNGEGRRSAGPLPLWCLLATFWDPRGLVALLEKPTTYTNLNSPALHARPPKVIPNPPQPCFPFLFSLTPSLTKVGDVSRTCPFSGPLPVLFLPSYVPSPLPTRMENQPIPQTQL